MQPFEQTLTPDSYSRQEELTFAGCDRSRRIRPAKILSIMAAAAGYDYDARGLTYEVLYGMRQAFLLSKAAFRIHRYPMAGDVLNMMTWENGAHGAHLRRVYELTDRRNGEVCVSGKSEWILVDPVTRKILRPASFTGKSLTECPKEIDAPECVKVTLPGESAEERGTRTVVWSDLDGNGHVYSGNYGDIIWDALPASLQDRPLREFQLNYHKEAVLGEQLRLLGVKEENTYRMEGRGDGSPCFTTLCTFEPEEH